MPSSHSSNYCAYCGAWALEQQEGFCIPCWDDFKTKTKKEKEMNITDGVAAEAAELNTVSPETRAKCDEIVQMMVEYQKWNDRLYRMVVGIVDMFNENTGAPRGRVTTKTSMHPESPPESSGQPEQPRA